MTRSWTLFLDKPTQPVLRFSQLVERPSSERGARRPKQVRETQDVRNNTTVGEAANPITVKSRRWWACSRRPPWLWDSRPSAWFGAKTTQVRVLPARLSTRPRDILRVVVLDFKHDLTNPRWFPATSRTSGKAGREGDLRSKINNVPVLWGTGAAPGSSPHVLSWRKASFECRLQGGCGSTRTAEGRRVCPAGPSSSRRVTLVGRPVEQVRFLPRFLGRAGPDFTNL